MKPSEELRVEVKQLEKDIQKLVNRFNARNEWMKLRLNVDNINTTIGQGYAKTYWNKVTVEVGF